MSWLVTGGAGYIGSHVVRALRDVDIPAVVIDNLDTGHRRFVRDDVPFVDGNILDTDLLVRTITDHDVHGVIHLAGFKAAGVSVDIPLVAYTQNVTGTVSVLEAMQRSGVDKMVFSSSAACYGTTDVDLVTEALPPAPESPYGETKLIGEWLMRDQAIAAGLKHTSLRYFNVVGSGAEDLFDDSAHNLFPLIFNALLAGNTPKIYGDDYSTPDGTCVRDYVHVADLAAAHAVAARHLENGDTLQPVYNLGSGAGSSVKEIMDAVREVSGIDFDPEIIPRRPGDPARIVADGKLAARDLDWKMRHNLHDMVESAWKSRQYHAGTRGLAMLALRPNCECCDRDLPAASDLARICTYECTFCADCVEGCLSGVCPNCTGNFVPRPIRPAFLLEKDQASTERVFQAGLHRR